MDDELFWCAYELNPLRHPVTHESIDEQYWSDLLASFIIAYRQELDLRLLHPRYEYLFGNAPCCDRAAVKAELQAIEAAYTAALLRTHLLIYIDSNGTLDECMTNDLRIAALWSQFLANFEPRARMWEVWRNAVERRYSL